MKKFLPPVIFLIISAGVTFSWFRHGLIYGGGDVGLPTYDPARIFEIARFVWWDGAAPGTPVPHGLTSVPVQFGLSILQLVGFSPLWLQATLFFLLLFLMGFGMYLFVVLTFGGKFRYFALVAGLFYMFNPYMMISVWHRFVHNAIFLAATLPYLVIFWIAWLKKGSLKYLLFFLITNLLGVYLYGSLAFIVTVWLLMFLITLGLGIFPWQGIKNLTKIFSLFLIGLFCFVLTNAWWLVPTFTVGPGLFSKQHSLEENVVGLISLSRQSILPFTLQLINPFYVINQSDFGKAHKQIPFSLIPWLIFAVVTVGLVAVTRLKDKVFWAPVFLSIVFLAKGAAAPFEFIYLWAFTNFFPLGIIRNPFEKIGILLPFVSSILFVVGLQILYLKLKRIFDHKGAVLILISLMLVILVYAWPMFLGKIFGQLDNPSFVEVPPYIRSASEWIKMQGREGRILHLPLSVTEDISYKWQWGYQGVESSDLFFSSSSVARGFNLQPVDDTLSTLSLFFNKAYGKNLKPLEELIGALNIRFIVLHKDIDWKGKEIYSPDETEKFLENLPLVKKKVRFGELLIYEVNEEVYSEKVSVAQNLAFVTLGKNLKVWPWLAKSENGDMVSPAGDSLDQELLEQASIVVVTAKEQMTFSEASKSALLNKTDPTSPLARLTRTKALLAQNGEVPSLKIAEKMIASSEALIEMANLKTDQLVSKYKSLIEELFKTDIKNSRLLLYLDRQIIANLFSEHLYILEQLQSPLYPFLKEKLVANNLSPQFATDSRPGLSYLRQVFRFDVPQKGNYEVLMTDAGVSKFYSNHLGKVQLQIDEKAMLLDGKQNDDFISFGSIALEKGQHEVSYFSPQALNLAPAGESKDPVNIALEAVGKDTFKVSFQAKVIAGNGFSIQLEQEGGGGPNEFVSQAIQNDWVSYEFTTLPLMTTTRSAVLRIIFDTGQVLLKDLRVERVLTSQLILRARPLDGEDLDRGTVENFVRNNPTSYKGRIKIIKPALLIFKESFHPKWKLTLKSESAVYTPDGHYISNLYGNAWLVENTGEYDFEITFEPQSYVNWGLFLGGATFTVLVSMLLVKKLRRL